MVNRPDIVLHLFGRSATLEPRSAAADSFLSRKFAQVEGDLTLQDINRIVAQAKALGFVIVEA
jgi:hypothetical protein